MTRTLTAMLTGMVIAATGVTGCASPVASTGPTPLEMIDGTLDGQDAPVALPRRVPEGYVFDGSGGVNHRQGVPVATAWTFAPLPSSADGPVVLCIREQDAPSDVCPAGDPTSASTLERTTSRYIISVSPASTDMPGVPTAWTWVEFTEDWRSLPWMQEHGVDAT